MQEHIPAEDISGLRVFFNAERNIRGCGEKPK